MTDSQPPQSSEKKKLLENSVMGSMAVPVAIVLVGALIIFGVTKMVSTDRSYKDLVREMQSKTFGNRWVAAYELSKLISAKQIPSEEIPWLIENLSDIYDSSKDSRTKDFIVASLGALEHPKALNLLDKVVATSEKKMEGDAHFYALAALGNYSKDIKFDWDKVITFLDSDDEGLQQAAILALANHRVPQAQSRLEKFLNHETLGLRYSAAMGLIYYKSQKALPELRRILLRSPPQMKKGERAETAFGPNDLQALRLNILHVLRSEKWTALNDVLRRLTKNEANKKLALRSQEILNQLKK